VIVLEEILLLLHVSNKKMINYLHKKNNINKIKERNKLRKTH